MRHAKALNATNQITDFNRPLESIGKVNARSIGNRLFLANNVPDLIISSDAKRALNTAQIIRQELQISEDSLITRHDLYLASAGSILDIINSTNNSLNSICLVCHNPGISELNYLLTGTFINMVTSTVIKIEFDTNEWKAVFNRSGYLADYDVPISNSNP